MQYGHFSLVYIKEPLVEGGPKTIRVSRFIEGKAGVFVTPVSQSPVKRIFIPNTNLLGVVPDEHKGLVA